MPVSRPYNTESQLNRVVDYLAPESLEVRRLIFEADRSSLTKMARLWGSQKSEAWPSDMQNAIEALARTGEIVMNYLLNSVSSKSEVIDLLRQLYVPQGEYMVACIPAIIDWLDGDEVG